MKRPSLRELVELEWELFRDLLFSFGGGWRTVVRILDSAAPHAGQSRIFSAMAVKQAGHLFIGLLSYMIYQTLTALLLTT
jgi:hypothetical protein